MESNINLNWLRTFEAAARLSDSSAAARELGLTQVAVSQHIKALETKLGHDLFVRRAQRVQLTEAGRAYLPSVRLGLEQLSHATYGLFGSNSDRTIVLRSSLAFLTWLAPRMRHFSQLYPNITIKLVTSLWPDPVDTQKVDIDIVLTSGSNYFGPSEKLSDEYIVPVCGKHIAKEVSSISDLTALEPIHIVGFDDHWSRYLKHFNVPRQDNIHQHSQLQVDTSVLACELVASSDRCAIVIERFARSAIDSGRPLRMIGEPAPLHQSHFLMRKENGSEAPVSAEVETLKEWIRTELNQ